MGGAAAEVRGDGELRARQRADGRRWRSGVSGRGTGERVRGLAGRGSYGADACERESGGALSHAVHGGSEVAASGAVGARGTGRRAPARGQKSGEGLGRDVWVPRRAGGGRGQP